MVGAGGHAKSVLDIALQNSEYEIVGCLDVKPGTLLGVPILGTDELLPQLINSGVRYIFIALGNNLLRKKLFDYSSQLGYHAATIIHKSATISPNAIVGAGTCVMAGATINAGSTVGTNCIVNTNASIDHDCQIGNHAHLAPGVTLSGYVTCGEGVHIGTGSCIIDRITIGEGCYIGAGSVVVKNQPGNALVFGNPARLIRNME